jgi:hypothetical protein
MRAQGLKGLKSKYLLDFSARWVSRYVGKDITVNDLNFYDPGPGRGVARECCLRIHLTLANIGSIVSCDRCRLLPMRADLFG